MVTAAEVSLGVERLVEELQIPAVSLRLQDKSERFLLTHMKEAKGPI